jgi:oxygen-independent coproporphyrinogen-3 oxidase
VSAPLGIYIHVPFCRTRCRYCDFYRVGENAERLRLFLVALHREIDGLGDVWGGREVDTVFFGGGTPSLLAPQEVAEVLARLRAAFRLRPEAEISAECNPSDLGPQKLAAYREAGLNRLSLGAQSFCDRELRLLGRRHDARRAAECVAWTRAAGFENLSLDLMLAIPGQTEASFHRSLARALELAPDHLSLYLLEVHAGSEIDLLRRQRPGLFPGEEPQRRRYLHAAERLPAAGYEHYEVSNFCRPGRAARHNLKYWRCEPYLGLGPAAHSQVDGRRHRHLPDLAAYLRDPLAREELPCDLAAERVFLGLRLAAGVARGAIARASRVGDAELDRRLRSLAPFVETAAGRVRLNAQGFVVSNAVLAELLAEPAAAGEAAG